MTKSNRVLIIVLTFMVTCLIGYALFSENITVTGTATAQGNLSFTGSCQTGIPSNMITSAEYQFDTEINEYGYKNDSCSFSGTQGAIVVDFEYPGANRYFTIKITNNGTIAATLGDINVKDFEVCLADVCNKTQPNANDAGGVGKRLTMFKDDPMLIGIQVGSANPIPYAQITQAQAVDFIYKDGSYMLKPGNSAFFAISVEADSSIGLDKPGSFELSNEIIYEIPFTQITMD